MCGASERASKRASANRNELCEIEILIALTMHAQRDPKLISFVLRAKCGAGSSVASEREHDCVLDNVLIRRIIHTAGGLCKVAAECEYLEYR